MSNNTKRILFFIASIIVSVGIPLTAIIIKYDMIHKFARQTTRLKISIIGAIIFIILFTIFFKKIVKFLNDQEFSMTLVVIKNIIKIIPLVCISLLLINMMYIIDDLMYVFGWIVGCNIISLIFIQPFVEKYSYLTKKDNAKKLIKEAIGEYNESKN